MKKTIILGSLLAGGLLFANDEKVTENRLSSWERQGLETQSPRVHTRGMEKHKRYDNEGVAQEKIREGYRVVSDKTTVNAFIPEGK